MILTLIKEKLVEILQPRKYVVIHLGEFTKEEIKPEENKIYLENKETLAVELKKIKNQLLSLHQKIRTEKDKDEILRIQGGINELYKIFNRLNIIVNPELYIIKK